MHSRLRLSWLITNARHRTLHANDILAPWACMQSRSLIRICKWANQQAVLHISLSREADHVRRHVGGCKTGGMQSTKQARPGTCDVKDAGSCVCSLKRCLNSGIGGMQATKQARRGTVDATDAGSCVCSSKLYLGGCTYPQL